MGTTEVYLEWVCASGSDFVTPKACEEKRNFVFQYWVILCCEDVVGVTYWIRTFANAAVVKVEGAFARQLVVQQVPAEFAYWEEDSDCLVPLDPQNCLRSTAATNFVHGMFAAAEKSTEGRKTWTTVAVACYS